MNRAVLALVAAMLLVAAPATGQQQSKPLPDGWVLHQKIGPFMGSVAVACSRRLAYARGWGGDVGSFDGKRWRRLPPIRGYQRGHTYGRKLAVSPDGARLFMEASGKVARWNGQAWSLLKMPGWKGPLGAMTVLPSGELLVVGDGRIGLIRGEAIKSHDAGTWRSLGAVAAADSGSLYTAGQGGTVMHHDGKRWTRMKTGVTAWLGGLHVGQKDRVWAWSRIGRWRSTTVVLHHDGGSWSRADTGLTSSILGMAGRGARPWAVGESYVARKEGSAWVTKLTTKQLGEGYHQLVGICATGGFLYVGDGSHSLVRPLR